VKVLSSTINSDGHFSILVEGLRLTLYRETAVIPNRSFMIQQAKNSNNQAEADRLTAMTDADYLNDALAKLAKAMETEAAPDAAAAALLTGVTGKEFKAV
jgi:hypothetical protein